MSFFRIVRPLFRPQAVPGLSCNFFQSNSPMGLNTGAPRILAPQSIHQRFYASPSSKKKIPSSRKVPFGYREPARPASLKQSTPAQPTHSSSPLGKYPTYFQRPSTEDLEASRMRHMEGELKNKNYLLWGFIAINVAAFLYANYLRMQAQQTRDPMNFFVYMNNATLSLNGFLQEHRYWTLVTSMFSHIDPWHVICNMVSFYYMGGLLKLPGTRFSAKAFGTLVMGSGILGGLCYMLSKSLSPDPTSRNQSALGFSGAVSGVTTMAALLFPRMKVRIWGIIPVPLWLLAGGYLLYDGFYMSARDGVAHSGHLGGALFGVLYYFLHFRGLGRYTRSIF